MKFIRGTIRTIIGAMFGFLAMLAMMPAFAAFDTGNGKASSAAWAVAIIGAILGMLAPNIRRSFGRGFLLVGAAVFALPISTLILSGRVANDTIAQASTADHGAAVAGAGLAGIAMTGAATFIGLIVGSILLIIGLILSLGGRREVIIVEKAK
ncbi:hypothetical protein [Paenirhodobacter sp. CAU 1674]|uniref:hypothetical protein n=1 Tax=Paenirhodobacter sp. CAU 1674 TaxID=3032596 RepID=UPI0023DBB31E|nr:hypothetical protein [Paenirhodobacter sp. CAU 1674]MDF2140835.1 hypothetical protein [Paenirhodobacter sp. CAU 1674]